MKNLLYTFTTFADAYDRGDKTERFWMDARQWITMDSQSSQTLSDWRLTICSSDTCAARFHCQLCADPTADSSRLVLKLAKKAKTAILINCKLAWHPVF